MIAIENFTDGNCELGLTGNQNASICAALPRSSNGKTTDSDSVVQAPKTSKLRNLDGICSPPETVGQMDDCEQSSQAILSELARVKAVFQLRTICAAMGVNAPLASGKSCVAGGVSDGIGGK